MDKSIFAAYKYCKFITKNHYENFPVASFIVPKKQRPAITAIYAFSRIADDFADEDLYKNCRINRLEEWEKFLKDPNPPTHPVFIALQQARSQFDLPQNLFLDLLTAFKMDVNTKRYQNYDDVLFYCKHSANPVGRLILHLFDHKHEALFAMSDAICTALQLTNFWQDVAIDLKKDRIYLPLEDCKKFDVTEDDLLTHKYSTHFKDLLEFEIARTIDLFLKGKNLGLAIKGKLGLELRLTWLTGITILQKIRQVKYDVFENRPKLSKKDFLKLFFVALSKKRYERFMI